MKVSKLYRGVSALVFGDFTFVLFPDSGGQADQVDVDENRAAQRTAYGSSNAIWRPVRHADERWFSTVRAGFTFLTAED